jgi:hypothetical protein
MVEAFLLFSSFHHLKCSYAFRQLDSKKIKRSTIISLNRSSLNTCFQSRHVIVLNSAYSLANAFILLSLLSYRITFVGDEHQQRRKLRL